MSPKLLKKLGLIIGIFVVIIIILFGFASCSGGGSSSKLKSIRTEMVQNAYKYYQKKDNIDDLPQEDGDSTSITLKKLIQEGYMKEPSEAYGDESLKCSGEVFVENNNGHYLYTPYIECKSDKEDNKVSTIYLKDKIIEDQLVESSVGLYAVGNTYVEKGEVTKNYIQIDEELYRIVRINEDGTIRIMGVESINNARWDNRYNSEQNKNYGINEFIYNDINSRLNEKLITNYDKQTNKLKSYLTTQNLCIGKRSVADTSHDGSTECSKTIKVQYGALAVYEYLQASLDKECSLPSDRSCRNYNWLSGNNGRTWTVTADAESNYKAFNIQGTAQLDQCNSTNDVFPVFNISSKVLYKEGSGTEKDPYILRYYPVGDEYKQVKKDKKNKNSD